MLNPECCLLLALLVMTVGVKMTSCRNLVFIGALICSLSYVISSQAKSINVVLVSYGIITGKNNIA